MDKVNVSKWEWPEKCNIKKKAVKKLGVPARFLLVGASQYEPFAIFFASFSIELNGTSIKKLTSLILCDYLKILLVSRKT